MEIARHLALLLYAVSGTTLLVILAIPVMVRVYDRLALKAARKYCEEVGLEFIEAKAFSNHHGLYFRKEGKRLHASDDFQRNQTITWRKGSPLEITAKQPRT